MNLRALLIATFVGLSCLSLSVVGQRDGYFRFHQQWWEHGWPFVWITRWGAQRDENYLVTRTLSLPLDLPPPYHFYPLGMLADLTIVMVLTGGAARLFRRPLSLGWKFGLANVFAACLCLGVALHLLQYFYPVLVFHRDHVDIEDKGWVLAALPGVLVGVYSTTLAMCRLKEAPARG